MTDTTIDAPPPVPTTIDKVLSTTGADYWSTHPIPGYGSLRFADGPHGLRVQNDDASDHLGLNRSRPATCFPPAVTLSASWDPQLISQVGAALGREASAEGVHVVLGPGMNLKRSPLCGRNFEYWSEDPLLSGLLAAALINGLQSEGVAACVKHFAANNQETERLRISADIDERPLRETYLRGFQIAVAESNPWTLMTAYNRVNGVNASENEWLLTEVLRNEWGFDGVVISDWGAVQDPVAAVHAGLDVRMPGRPEDRRIHDGAIDDAALDRTIDRLTMLAERTVPRAAEPNHRQNHLLTRRAAAESAVLLTNVDATLPLSGHERIAVIGELARTPRYQGVGSSLVNPTSVTSALDAFESRSIPVEFAAGYTLDGTLDSVLVADAVRVATEADTVVLFVGLPDRYEAEGSDRTHIDLPSDQLTLISALAEVSGRIIVAMNNGSVVTTAPWRDDAAAIVEFWLTGQAHGDSILDVLLGEVNPSGKLAETIPQRLQDTPSYLDFPGESGHARYSEGIHVGYRYYDSRDVPVDFAFGHGLSYTSFEYGSLDIVVHDESDPIAVSVSLQLRNAGTRAGAEVVQVYLRDEAADVIVPEHELRGFTKIFLEPSESRTVLIEIPRNRLQYWVTGVGWSAQRGANVVQVGSSSRDIRLQSTITLPGAPLIRPITEWSTLGEWSDHPELGPALWKRLDGNGGVNGRLADLLSDNTGRHSVLQHPVMSLVEFAGFPITPEEVAELLDNR